MAPHTAPLPARDELPPALRDCAPWWIGVLERALRERDYAAAAEADSELARLGWHVSARPAPATPEPRSDAREVEDAPLR